MTKKINDLTLASTVLDTMQFETDIGGTTANKVVATAISTYVSTKILGAANTWTGQQTFSTSAPIFSTMTAGSVLFAGASGVLSQNNANFFWDNTNNRLGIGTSSPLTPLYVQNSAAATDTINTKINTSAAGNYYTNLAMYNTASAAGSPILNLFALGSGYNVAGIFNGSDAGFIVGQGVSTSNFIFGPVNASGNLKIITGGTGTANERIRINPAGQIGMNTTSFGTQARLTINPNTSADNSAVTQINAINTTDKGLVVQDVASQSGHSFELQSSSGTANVYGSGTSGSIYASSAVFVGAALSVNASGDINNLTSTIRFYGTQIISRKQFLVGSSGEIAANVVPFTVYGASGQTADIMQIVNYGGTYLASITAAGAYKTSSGNESTGSGSATLGANSPAITLTAPYKWLTFNTSDGSTVYVPVWK